MNKKTAMQRLAKAIVEETIAKLSSQIWEENWNPASHVEITLTIDELRCADFLNKGTAPGWWAKPLRKKKRA